MNSLIGFPCSAIPRLETQAHSVLLMLLEGNKKTSELAIGLGGKNPRSGLQSLMNDTHNYWNIINVGIEGSNEAFYKIDPRHLSSNPELDKQARTERFLTLLKEQKDGNQGGANRLFESIEALQEAESLFSPQLKLPLKKKN
ncbi:hypothetical protein OLEAN_C10870 [Oleispira antarctica RB-8]|uniref:Uncharacterized protein n=1 Tax=Oleispira antarctica RB-8 TaxID=698738 RepID=R4YPS6_OLEAN|nr:hypothetical protein OLEAN_C10870 [Oleispira antarctica RB-8]